MQSRKLNFVLKATAAFSADFAPGGRGKDGLFECVFTVEDAHHTPCLTASDDGGWSLLGWKGPFTYVGQHTMIHCSTANGYLTLFPTIDEWIGRMS